MPSVAESWVEVPYDTGRAVMSLLMSGTLARLQDIRWIFSHGGGTVPILAERVKTLGGNFPSVKKAAPKGIDYELNRLHYETANAAHKPNMSALLAYIPTSQVMFGTDYPYLTVGENAEALRRFGLAPADLQAIETGNAIRLMPRLKAYSARTRVRLQSDLTYRGLTSVIELESDPAYYPAYFHSGFSPAALTMSR